jgi:hypothetical protein
VRARFLWFAGEVDRHQLLPPAGSRADRSDRDAIRSVRLLPVISDLLVVGEK